ncbi:MAG TPA: hypothetical protein VM553_17650 [Dongiaceae bacterium]|nr:hypothetical protein [Dongiaceae bacterium]
MSTITSINSKRNKLAMCCAGALFGVLAMTNANAGDSKYEATMDQIERSYEAAEAHCDTMSGNNKDICIKQAKADKATSEANAKATREHHETNVDARQEKRDAQYKVEKEKCDTLSGDDQDACVERAKANYKQ